MADRFPKQLVGVVDGTAVPAAQADGREVGANLRCSTFSKVPGTTWAIGDRFCLGRKASGEKVVRIDLIADASLAASTVSVGTTAAPGKYVPPKTNTVVEQWTNLGPLVATLDDPIPGEEDLWATIGAAAIAAGTNLTFAVYTSGI